MSTSNLRITSAFLAFAMATGAFAQNEQNAPAPERQQSPAAPPAAAGNPPLPSNGAQDVTRRGPGGPGPQPEVKLVAKFDEDGDKRLNTAERKAAREFLKTERAAGRLGRGFGPRRGPGGPGGAPGSVGAPGAPDGAGAPGGGPGGGPPGGPFGGRENLPPPEPGEKLTPKDVKSYRAMPLYDIQTLRTLFLDFENADWEKELMEFHGTDVEVPATLTVDGAKYENVGVHFRGASSFMMVGEGRKHSLNLSLDFVHEKQDLGGYRTLNLLNSAGDPTFLRAVLYYQIAREYLPAPKANWVRVAVNGESWGVYVNVQQFNKDFVDEWFGTKKGARWKAPGRPNGNSGLEYLGDDVAEYRKRYEIKSSDDPKSWEALIELCRVLNQTPAEELEEKLSPLLAIDGVLKFLALENVFINTDGYWTRASDYSIYREESGRFHIIPHDVNETFRAAGGPGMRGGGSRGGGLPPGADGASSPAAPGAPPAGPSGGAPDGAPRPEGTREEPPGRGLHLDPVAGADDPRKPLLSKLLAVPKLRERYLGLVREMATTWLDWNKLGPLAQQYQAMLADEVKKDTRKLASFEAFGSGVSGESNEGGPRRMVSLKEFAEIRRAFLLSHPEIQKLEAPAEAAAEAAPH